MKLRRFRNRASQGLLAGAIFLAAFANATVGIAGTIHPSVSYPQQTQLTTLSTLQPYIYSVIVADLDGDGLKDVVVASQLPSKICWYRNNGDGTFSGPLTISTALAAPTCIFAADIDGDGRIDIAASSGPDNMVVWFKNVGGSLASGLFGFQAAAPSANVRTVSAISNFPEQVLAVTIADLDADGLPDILAASFGPNPANPTGSYVSKISWYKNLGAGNFGWNAGNQTANQRVISNAGIAPTSITVADLNKDGILDLVVTSNNDDTLAWFKGTGVVNGNPQFTRYVISNNQLRASTAAIGDLDGDGFPDIVCASPFGQSVTWFRNASHDAGASAPYFGAGQEISGVTNGVESVAIADLNADGFSEVLSASFLDNKVAWYQNLGLGNFGWNQNAPLANQNLIATTSTENRSIAVADFNGDGLLDIVAGAQDGSVSVFLNRGGQSALASANAAPATILNGSSGSILNVAVSNRGIIGDDNAQLSSVALFFEKSPGVALTTAEAAALISNLKIYVDSNNSGAFDANVDALVGTASNLQLNAGKVVVTLAPANAADAQIAPGATRNFFVVAQIADEASAQNANTFRITHIGQGSGHSVIKDAISGAVLSVESATSSDVPSSFVTATPTIIQAWRQTYFNTISNSGDAADTANPDNDSLVNLAEFAFGTNPKSNQSNPVTVNGSVITPGAPTTLVVVPTTSSTNFVDFRAVFGRRKDYVAAGLSYTVEFSHDLNSWTASTDEPTIYADDGTIQVVTVPYPFFINGKKANFFRVVITGP